MQKKTYICSIFGDQDSGKSTFLEYIKAEDKTHYHLNVLGCNLIKFTARVSKLWSYVQIYDI